MAVEAVDEMFEREEKALNLFKEKHQERIDRFLRENPGKPLPIFKDKNGMPVWLNRKQRRNSRVK